MLTMTVPVDPRRVQLLRIGLIRKIDRLSRRKWSLSNAGMGRESQWSNLVYTRR
jgi:hypothetical protein